MKTYVKITKEEYDEANRSWHRQDGRYGRMTIPYKKDEKLPYPAAISRTFFVKEILDEKK